jgi:hypothetical protein
MLPRKLYPVRDVHTHYAPHEDELLSRELALRFGKEKFPGIQGARIVLMDAGLHPENGHDGDHYLVTHGSLCIGVCGGMFDEHGKLLDSEQHMRSAAARMAAWLGVQDDPGLKPILDFSLRADRHAGNGNFELPNLIKAWWNAGVRLEDGLSMYHAIFRSLYWKFSGFKRYASPRKGEFRRLVAEWFVKEFSNDRGATAACLKLKTGSDAAKFFEKIGDDTQTIRAFDRHDDSKTDFDLRSIWEAMLWADIPSKERERVVFASLHAEYVRQLDFVASCSEYGREVAYLADSRSSGYQVAIVASDSLQMHRVARHLDPDTDMLIQFRTDGHVQVFDLYNRLNVNAIAAQLRMAEWAKHNMRGRLSMDELLSEGTLPHIRQWFNWQEGHGVFCGTITAPHTPCTWLTRDEVVDCVARGLEVVRRNYRTMSQRVFQVWLKRKRERKCQGQQPQMAATA